MMSEDLLLFIQEKFPGESEFSVQMSILGINNGSSTKEKAFIPSLSPDLFLKIDYMEFYDGMLSQLSSETLDRVSFSAIQKHLSIACDNMWLMR
jgi:hypothetical protein